MGVGGGPAGACASAGPAVSNAAQTSKERWDSMKFSWVWRRRKQTAF
jgi:hypothetical protein